MNIASLFIPVLTCFFQIVISSNNNNAPADLFSFIMRSDWDGLINHLADPHVDPNQNEWVPLNMAVVEGRTEVVQSFLNHPNLEPKAAGMAFSLAIIEARKLKPKKIKTIHTILQHPRVDPRSNEMMKSLLGAEGSGFLTPEVALILLEDARIIPCLYPAKSLRPCFNHV